MVIAYTNPQTREPIACMTGAGRYILSEIAALAARASAELAEKTTLSEGKLLAAIVFDTSVRSRQAINPVEVGRILCEMDDDVRLAELRAEICAEFNRAGE